MSLSGRWVGLAILSNSNSQFGLRFASYMTKAEGSAMKPIFKRILSKKLNDHPLF
jgi:hypothetical protein